MRTERKQSGIDCAAFERAVGKRDAEVILRAQMDMPGDLINLELADACARVILGSDYPTPDPERQARAWACIEALRKPSEVAQAERVKATWILAAVIVLLIAAATVGLATGLFPWKLDLGCDDEQFHVTITPDEQSGYLEGGDSAVRPTGLNEELDRSIEALDIRAALPTWIPEGFTFGDLTIEDDKILSMVDVLFVKGDANLTICVERYKIEQTSVVSDYEKDDGPMEVYQINGLEHYLFSNRSKENAVWFDGDTVVFIGGGVSREEIREMIDSTIRGG